MILYTVLLSVVMVFLYVLKTMIKPANFPPGPMWLPIVGTLPLIKRLCKKYKSQHLALEQLKEYYNSDIISLKYGHEKYVVVFSQELIKDMFTLKPFQGRPDNFFIRMRTNGKRSGITMTDGPICQEHRRFLLKHLRQLGLGKNLMEQMIIDEYIIFEKYLDKQILEEIYLSSNVSASVINVLWMLTAGYKFEMGGEKLNNILNLMKQRGKAFQITGGTLACFPWLRFFVPDLIGYTLLKSISQQLFSLIDETIQDHKRYIENNVTDLESYSPRDFIDAFVVEMMQDKESYTRDQLLAICLDLFIAGAETTTNTFDFALLNMVLHPEIQQKVQDQIDEVLKPNEKPTYILKQKLPYIEAVLLESQRMYNVIPITGAHRATEDATLGGYSIPKDTLILSNLYSIHHNPEIWDEPEKFKPERFLKEDGSFNYCETLYQFGFGKRRCIGETLAKSFLFIYFVGILHRYKLTTIDENISSFPLPGISLSPKPYKVILSLRHTSA